MRSLLCCLAVVLVFVSTGRAQPERDCLDTGDNCRENCFASSRYQWCGSCTHYLDCTSGSAVIQECPPDLVWNDNAGVCAATSPTCTQCVIPAANCAGTGANCLNDCLGQFDGIYQWCGRCDYFIQCSAGATTFTKCQQDTLFYDDNFKACVAVSGTCADRPCDIALGPCQSNPCLNGGLCGEQDGGWVCSCPPGYSGAQCQDSVCNPNPCFNGGFCSISGGGGWVCTCQPGWTGTQCQDGICDPNPCYNGGVCSISGGGWVCSCPPGYSGTQCQDSVCVPNPCFNGGVCSITGGGGWVCTCPPGWTGTQCQNPDGPCTPNPCLNGGACYESGGIAYCTCPSSWTGTRCESPNYVESCGSGLFQAIYPAVNGFTILCSFTAAPDSEDRLKKCKDTLSGLPLWSNADGLLAAGGNFGCYRSPTDFYTPVDSNYACQNNYQHEIDLGSDANIVYMMVCLRFPYEGINPSAIKRKV